MAMAAPPITIQSEPGPLRDCFSLNGSMIFGCSGTMSFSTQPRCESGWTLVLDGAGKPMCAYRLKAPKSG